MGKAQVIEYLERETKGKKDKDGDQEVRTLTNMIKDLSINKQTICSTLRRFSRKEKEIYGIKEKVTMKRASQTREIHQEISDTKIQIRAWWIE